MSGLRLVVRAFAALVGVALLVPAALQVQVLLSTPHPVQFAGHTFTGVLCGGAERTCVYVLSAPWLLVLGLLSASGAAALAGAAAARPTALVAAACGALLSWVAHALVTVLVRQRPGEPLFFELSVNGPLVADLMTMGAVFGLVAMVLLAGAAGLGGPQCEPADV